MKSSKNPRKWAYKYGHKFFVCLGALPSTINTNANEPDWIKAKKNGELRPCLFWFENEEKYNTLKAKVGEKNVRSKEFQVSFAELALGIIVLAHESAVSINEKRALKLLHQITEKEIILSSEHMELKDEHFDSKKEFAIVTKSRENEYFDSHKFRADSEEIRDEWTTSIGKMLRKRLHSMGGENLGRTIARMRKKSASSLTSHRLDQLLSGRRPSGLTVSLRRPTFTKPSVHSQWSNNSLPSGFRQEDKSGEGRHRRFKTGEGQIATPWMNKKR